MKSASLLIVALAILHTTQALADDQAPPLTPSQVNAAKLAGLAGFVNMSCQEIRTDKDRFRAAIERIGVNPDDLERGALRLSAESYIGAYQKDAPASCSRAAELFGTGGSVIPGVFVSR